MRSKLDSFLSRDWYTNTRLFEGGSVTVMHRHWATATGPHYGTEPTGPRDHCLLNRHGARARTVSLFLFLSLVIYPYSESNIYRAPRLYICSSRDNR